MEIWSRGRKKYWSSTRQRILFGDYSIKRNQWLCELASKYTQVLAQLKINFHDVLQIGSGTNDVINYISQPRARLMKIAVDPLYAFYKNSFSRYFNTQEVKFLESVGEYLPLKDETFDLVIVRNVLDHTFDPNLVLEESHRVLRHNKALILWCYVHPPLETMLSKVSGLVAPKKDPHLYRFWIKNLRKLLKSNNFAILHENLQEYEAVTTLQKCLKVVHQLHLGYLAISIRA